MQQRENRALGSLCAPWAKPLESRQANRTVRQPQCPPSAAQTSFAHVWCECLKREVVCLNRNRSKIGVTARCCRCSSARAVMCLCVALSCVLRAPSYPFACSRFHTPSLIGPSWPSVDPSPFPSHCTRHTQGHRGHHMDVPKVYRMSALWHRVGKKTFWQTPRTPVSLPLPFL